MKFGPKEESYEDDPALVRQQAIKHGVQFNNKDLIESLKFAKLERAKQKQQFQDAIEENEDEEPCYRHKLRLQEAEEIYQYVIKYNQGYQSWNFDRVDDLMKRFSFFAKFSDNVRTKLIRCCDIKKYRQGSVIFY